jgi:hypothetical protein
MLVEMRWDDKFDGLLKHVQAISSLKDWRLVGDHPRYLIGLLTLIWLLVRTNGYLMALL